MERVTRPGRMERWMAHPLESAAMAITLLLITAGAAIFVLPLYWTVIWSTWDTQGIFAFPPQLQPGTQFATNVALLEQQVPILRVTINSLIVAGVDTVGALFFCSLAGFAFAKYQFRGRNVLFYVLLATMAVPGQITVIPLFIIMLHLNWVDTYQAMIVPGLIPAFGIFLARQGIEETVPNELLQAARMDGAGEFRIYWQVVLPIIGPFLAALSIFLFSGNWGGFFWPLIILKSREMFTLPLALVSLIGQYNQPYNLLMVGSLILVTAPLIVFLALQRYFARSLVTGAFR